VAPARRPEIVGVKETLQDHAGINRVKATPRSGSLVVEYDDGSLGFDDVISLLADLGVLALETLGDEDHVGPAWFHQQGSRIVPQNPAP
jgi:hypothetical protein